MVLMALRLVRPNEQAELAKIFDRALAWQLSFQCRDGGWAAFDKDVTRHWLEDMPFADHNAILDPTCSDLTARTLELLGYIGFNPGRSLVRRAIRYLRQTQEADGSWFVTKRAAAANAYFESGFPHGKFQFISYAGSCWATMALMYAAAPPVS